MSPGNNLGNFEIAAAIGAGRMRILNKTANTKQEALASNKVMVTKDNSGMTASSVPTGAILDNWSDREWDNGVQIDEMEDLESLAVRTRNSVYEIVILSGHSGDVLVRGGQFFPTRTVAHLAGSTLGGSFLKMRGIYVGLRMEINFEGRRLITTPVQSIGIVLEDGKN